MAVNLGLESFDKWLGSMDALASLGSASV